MHDALMGELRSTLHGAPSLESWRQLCDLLELEQTPDDATLDYIDHLLAHWPDLLRRAPAHWLERPDDARLRIARYLRHHPSAGALPDLGALPGELRIVGLDLSGHHLAPPTIERLLAAPWFHKLRELKLHNCPLQQQTIEALASRGLAHLERLDLGKSMPFLSRNNQPPTWIYEGPVLGEMSLKKLLGRCPTICHLNIQNNACELLYVLDELAALGPWERLRSLYLGNVVFDEEGLGRWIEHELNRPLRAVLPRLETLSISPIAMPLGLSFGRAVYESPRWGRRDTAALLASPLGLGPLRTLLADFQVGFELPDHVDGAQLDVLSLQGTWVSSLPSNCRPEVLNVGFCEAFGDISGHLQRGSFARLRALNIERSQARIDELHALGEQLVYLRTDHDSAMYLAADSPLSAIVVTSELPYYPEALE